MVLSLKEERTLVRAIEISRH